MVSYADRPWVQHYDEGVPRSLMPYPDIPVFQLLDDTANTYPNNVACITAAKVPVAGVQHTEMTYRELKDATDRLAAALAQLGVKKGDRVAIVSPNCNQFIITFFGILRAGGVVVALNPTFPPAKWVDQFNDSGAEVVVALTPFYKGLNSIRTQTPIRHIILTNIKEYLPPLAKILFTVAKEKKDGHRVDSLQQGDYWFQDLLEKYTSDQRPKIQVDTRDTAIFQYTGGTTGVPKAARGPHRALVANALQMQKWMVNSDDPSQERSLAAIPLFHVYGMVAVMIFSVSQGITMIMVPNARDIDNLLLNIHHFRPTFFMGVPALYNAINFHPDVVAGKYDLSSVRACISGSAPLAPETKRRFEELTGGTVMEGFGMSEAPTATHCNPLKGPNKVGSIGMPLPDVECRIVSLDDGVTDVPPGEVGELVIHGPVMMTGYHNMPTETANTIRDGWLYTGDIARMDEDGYFFIVDRKKDMVLIGGFNVYPTNIEKTLMDHDAVAEAAVAGVPHPERPGQEALKAWIVKAPGQEITEKELLEYASSKLAPYEVPRRMEFVEALPKTAVGKILRRELVRMETESPEAQTPA